MTAMDEHFLAGAGSEYSIDPILPLRLQKRVLLRALGFPESPDLVACPSKDARTIEVLVEEYGSRGYPFLIIVSEKPMSTNIPPLFVVNGVDDVVWRDNSGHKKHISLVETLEVIHDFDEFTWIEFVKYLWIQGSIAGRLLYEGADRQVIELQSEVIPAQIMDNRTLAVYLSDLSFLEVEQYRYLEARDRILRMGYREVIPYNVVRDICKKLQLHFVAFEKLLTISTFPTLEFAITREGRFATIDIDWPSQWIIRRG